MFKKRIPRRALFSGVATNQIMGPRAVLRLGLSPSVVLSPAKNDTMMCVVLRLVLSEVEAETKDLKLPAPNPKPGRMAPAQRP
jgi:hypothetical protein